MSLNRKLVALGSLLALAVGTVVLFRNDLLIAYHKRVMLVAWNSGDDLPLDDPAQWELLVAFERHRDALVDLGYLEQHEFRFAPMSPGSDRTIALSAAIRAQSSDFPRARFQYDSASDSDSVGLLIWAWPGELSEWQTLIADHTEQEHAAPE